MERRKGFLQEELRMMEEEHRTTEVGLRNQAAEEERRSQVVELRTLAVALDSAQASDS